jgi:hypothetical protein
VKLRIKKSEKCSEYGEFSIATTQKKRKLQFSHLGSMGIARNNILKFF